MKRYGNVSYDDMQKLMDKSENKNKSKATVTFDNMFILERKVTAFLVFPNL